MIQKNKFKAKLLEGRLTRATHLSAGYDVYSTHDVIIPSKGSAVVETGVRLAIQDGYVAFLSHRSGINFKEGQVVPLGIIDADFSQDDSFIRAKFYNMTDEDYTIKANERVGQLVILEHYEIEGTEHLKQDRKGGFGSTNK